MHMPRDPRDGTLPDKLQIFTVEHLPVKNYYVMKSTHFAYTTGQHHRRPERVHSTSFCPNTSCIISRHPAYCPSKEMLVTSHLEQVGGRGSAACPSNVTVCWSDDSTDHLCIARRTSRKVTAESGNFWVVLNSTCPIAHFKERYQEPRSLTFTMWSCVSCFDLSCASHNPRLCSLLHPTFLFGYVGPYSNLIFNVKYHKIDGCFKENLKKNGDVVQNHPASTDELRPPNLPPTPFGMCCAGHNHG